MAFFWLQQLKLNLKYSPTNSVFAFKNANATTRHSALLNAAVFSLRLHASGAFNEPPNMPRNLFISPPPPPFHSHRRKSRSRSRGGRRSRSRERDRSRRKGHDREREKERDRGRGRDKERDQSKERVDKKR